MKPIRIAWCLAAAALVVGCQDDSTGPSSLGDEVTEPALKAVHVGFEQESYWNDVLHYSCLDENVWERGRRLSYKGRVFSSSGNANRWTMSTDFYGLPDDDPDYFGDEYTLLGLASGDVWTFERTSNSHSRMHQNANGFIYHGITNIWFENQDSEKLHVKESYKLKCPWDGECTLEQWKGGCLIDLPH